MTDYRAIEIHDINDAMAAVRSLLDRATLAEARLAKAVEALREIGDSDDIDNALDPERNKRIARAVLSELEQSE